MTGWDVDDVFSALAVQHRDLQAILGGLGPKANGLAVSRKRQNAWMRARLAS